MVITLLRYSITLLDQSFYIHSCGLYDYTYRCTRISLNLKLPILSSKTCNNMYLVVGSTVVHRWDKKCPYRKPPIGVHNPYRLPSYRDYETYRNSLQEGFPIVFLQGSICPIGALFVPPMQVRDYVAWMLVYNNFSFFSSHLHMHKKIRSHCTVYFIGLNVRRYDSQHYLNQYLSITVRSVGWMFDTVRFSTIVHPTSSAHRCLMKIIIIV